MTLYVKRLIIVVTEALASDANARAKEVDTVGGEHTFSVGLSLTGRPPATHRWCNWALTTREHDRLLARLKTSIDAGLTRVFDGLTTTPDDVLRAVGLKRVDG